MSTNPAEFDLRRLVAVASNDHDFAEQLVADYGTGEWVRQEGEETDIPPAIKEEVTRRLLQAGITDPDIRLIEWLVLNRAQMKAMLDTLESIERGLNDDLPLGQSLEGLLWG